jgi:uncharacterized protein
MSVVIFPTDASTPVSPGHGRLRPLGLSEVRIDGGFWADRQQVNAAASFDHCREWMERLGWIDNLRHAGAGTLDPEQRNGMIFSDSDVYKLVEAMAWESARRGGDAELDAEIDELADVFAAAQEPDGYLHTGFGRPGQRPRYSDLEWGHELYCYGHLIQAAVARLRGDKASDGTLVKVALRVADHVCEVFEHGGVCGHPEIEMALVELYRATGERRFLDQASRFVDRRGHGQLADMELERSYYQDDVPVRLAHRFSGHAVRALYLACGAVDVATETGDDELLAAVIRQWEHTIATRTYLTGGMGARSEGEAFGDDYELPPDGAYAETCAAVASVMLSWRLALATGEARFSDLAERTLYNAVAGGVAVDGRAFFYRNRLQHRVLGRAPQPDAVNPRPAADLRAPWFHVSCCLPNVARTFASLAAYIATADDAGLQLHQYAPTTVRTALPGGQPVGVVVDTGYPWRGQVIVRVTEASAASWTLSLRIPPWADGALASGAAGEQRAAAGWLRLTRDWRTGDEVHLQLPTTPRWTFPDPRIDAVRGQVALERGPVVYCAESPGDSGPLLERVEVDTGATPVEAAAADLSPDAVAVRVPARQRATADGAWPYASTPAEPGSQACRLELIPYHLRAHRGPATMRVWLPQAASPTEVRQWPDAPSAGEGER